MLPARHRLRSSAQFREVLRRGRRAGRPTLTVHLLPPVGGSAPTPTRAGLVVSKAVGNAVVRHQVSRRLRHLLRDRLEAVPPGSLLVVRAAPAAATAASDRLGGDLDAALSRLAPA